MIIICEGQDNCFKSTNIHAMMRYYYPDRMFHMLHYGGIRKDGVTSEEYRHNSELYYDEMFHILSSLPETNFVLDRSHIGDYVYGPMYRGYDGSYIFELEEKYDVKNWDDTCIIFFYDTPENCVSREDGYSYTTDLDKKRVEYEKFLEAVNKSAIPNKLLLNVQGKSRDEVFAEIKTFLDNVEKEMVGICS